MQLTPKGAFDHIKDETTTHDAIETARAAGLHRACSVYVLFGFKDTLDEARYKMDRVIEWGCEPCPMRYQPLDADEYSKHVAPGWTDAMLKKVNKYYWNYRFLHNVPFDEFRWAYDPKQIEMFKEAK